MAIQELRTEKERTLYTVCLVVSCVFWGLLVIGTLGLGLIYIAAAAAFILMGQAMFLAALKGNGVRITADQFPDLYARLEKASQKLELAAVPEAYLLNHRGAFNAFATRFLDRNFVVLYADLLEACAEDDGSIDFIIGHEIGHLAFGHVKMAPVLLPSRMVPLLGHAYSRSCEYSCDRAGTVVAGQSNGAFRGLAVLAAGGRYAPRLNVDEYLKQRLDTGGFWMGVVELAMSHPYLPKRLGAILGDTRPNVVIPKVERNPFAYIVSPMLAGGGAGGGVIIAVMIVGVMAAVAVPAFAKYKERSSASAASFNDKLKVLEEQAAEDEQPAVEALEEAVEPEGEAPAVEERQVERAVERPAARQVERQVERPAARQVERQVERPAARPSPRPVAKKASPSPTPASSGKSAPKWKW